MDASESVWSNHNTGAGKALQINDKRVFKKWVYKADWQAKEKELLITE